MLKIKGSLNISVTKLKKSCGEDFWKTKLVGADLYCYDKFSQIYYDQNVFHKRA